MLYSKLAELYDKIERTSKRLEKSFLLASFLAECPPEDLKHIIYLVQGRVFPQWDERKLGMSSKLLVKAISQATGESAEKVEKHWREEGDLGLVAEKLIAKKKQSTLFTTKITLNKVVDNISKLPTMEGEGTVGRKVGLIAELLSSASPLEARYIVRTVAEELRTGVGDSAVRDALVWAFYPRIVGIFFVCEKCKTVNPKATKCLACGEPIDDSFKLEVSKKHHPKQFVVIQDEKKAREEYNSYLEEVQDAYNVTNDFGVIAETLKEKGPKGLKHAALVVGKPVKAMLYVKAKDFAEGFEIVGTPAIIEPKFDGFRMQIHRKNDVIKLFTRRLEDVTKQFPDVVKVVKEHVRSKDVILDSEVVGIDPKTKRVIPFQNISQRIRRKYDIEQLVAALPVSINVFDVIELNGDSMVDIPLQERKERLKAILKQEKHMIEMVEQLVTSDAAKVEEYYKECLDKGHEGVMMKNVAGIYKPGKRVGYGVKIKPVMETLDLVIVAAEWGEGKRAKWLSSFTVACRDANQLKEIGKVGTGIKEKSEEGVSYTELTDELKKLIIEEKGKTVRVKPKVVLEVVYEEIQKSPSYSSGYALRFPRVHRLRLDKGVSDINTLKDVEHLYKLQK